MKNIFKFIHQNINILYIIQNCFCVVGHIIKYALELLATVVGGLLCMIKLATLKHGSSFGNFFFIFFYSDEDSSDPEESQILSDCTRCLAGNCGRFYLFFFFFASPFFPFCQLFFLLLRKNC